MRHAHTESGQDDRQRQLTQAGVAAAAVRGEQLAAAVRPDHVLCSTAVRARQTWELAREALGGMDAVFDDSLYLASTRALLDAIRSCPAHASCLLVVAHNPGLSDLARGIGRGRRELTVAMRPGDVIVLQTDAPTWADAADGDFTPIVRLP